MSNLKEINKNLELIKKSISCLLSNTENILAKLPTISVTRNKTLTGSLSTLSSETCISVTLRNNGNSLIYTSNGGNEQTMIANEIETIFVSNANLISVKGTGTLEYIVDKA